MPNQSSNFIHLHVHTQYSLLDSTIKFKPLFQKVKEYGMHSVAITDSGTMFGVIEFFMMAQRKKIKPIIGCECYVAPGSLKDKSAEDENSTHLVLLAENMEGYKNLCKLASIAQLEGFYHKPRIDNQVLSEYSKGLICLSSGLGGEISRLVAKGHLEKAEERALYYNNLFGENNFFLEVQENGLEAQSGVNKALLDMSRRLSIPLVCTNNCHFLNSEDAEAYEVLCCIRAGNTINSPEKPRFETNQLYFKSSEEMNSAFKDYPGAVSNTVDIAERCRVDLISKEYYFPKYNDGSGRTETEILTRLAEDGFEKRMAVIRKKNPDVDEKVYRDRLDYEKQIINDLDLDLQGYFLVVADFIQYASKNGIAVGPGRGAAPGSLVLFAMGITSLDPIEHGLIFERFLNPEHATIPYIYTDFCIRSLRKVHRYIIEKYGGPDCVSKIITFRRMKTKTVIRDVSRVLDIPLIEADAICKLIPDDFGTSLEAAIDQEPGIKLLADTKPEIDKLFKIGKILENLPRHTSTHPCEIVIGESPLTNYIPLCINKNGDVITQYSRNIGNTGLITFDLQGLENLTVIDDCLKLIESRGIERPDMMNIDLNDPKTFELFSRGDTKGVFQFESHGMKELLVRLKPGKFSDIAALVALYRPGPLESGMVEAFIERKRGRQKVVYHVDLLEPILNETYGVIIYQEQVMKIVADLAGYSMGQTNFFRKAMGMKKAELIKEHRKKFVDGCLEKSNISKEISSSLFDDIEKFAGYGFMKAHCVAYAHIGYQIAWLKAHYPEELIAAL